MLSCKVLACGCRAIQSAVHCAFTMSAFHSHAVSWCETGEGPVQWLPMSMYANNMNDCASGRLRQTAMLARLNLM